MTWLILILLSVFINSIANILQKVLMRSDKSDPISYAILFQFTFGSFNLIYGLIHGLRYPGLSTD